MAARLDVLQGRESLMNAKNLLTYTSLNPMMFGLNEPGTTNCVERRGGHALARARTVMEVLETVQQILKQKGKQVWSVTPTMTVYQAIEMMANKGIGALPVLSNGKLVGIISERDYARKVILKGKSSKETPVGEIMSGKVLTVPPNYSVDDCMRIMTHYRIRHLPVIQEEDLVGLISIGDLVKAIISTQAETIDQLINYIEGKYPA